MGHLRRLVTLRGHTGIVWSITWSSSGLLASCGSDKTIRLWKIDARGPSFQLITVFENQTFLRTTRDLTFSPDGRSMAVASFDASATILELFGGKNPRFDPVVVLEGHDSEVKSVAYSSSGGLLASCSRDRSIWLWEVGLDFDYSCIAVLHGHAGDVKCVTWHPECELLVSCSYDETIRVWVEDEDDWFCSEILTGHNGTVWAVAFKGAEMASASSDESLIVWQRESTGDYPAFRVVARIEGLHENGVLSVDWKTLIATVGRRGSAASCTSRGRNRVAWSPVEENLLASCGDDGLVCLWLYEDAHNE
ncbi:WD40-repeat containing protein [Gracilaria domingensis]|nr:WD40-repeat containing protein [Gracilaria domingensis]